jgi:hypothetical protein
LEIRLQKYIPALALTIMRKKYNFVRNMKKTNIFLCFFSIIFARWTIFSHTTENRPEKIFIGRKKIRGRKITNILHKVAENSPENIFLQLRSKTTESYVVTLQKYKF